MKYALLILGSLFCFSASANQANRWDYYLIIKDEKVAFATNERINSISLKPMAAITQEGIPGLLRRNVYEVDSDRCRFDVEVMVIEEKFTIQTDNGSLVGVLPPRTVTRYKTIVKANTGDCRIPNHKSGSGPSVY